MGAAGSTDVSPLEVMLWVMRARWADGDMPGALDVAKSAAPYVHGKAPPEAPKRSLTTLSDEELASWVDRLDPVEEDRVD
jgi:hypothetical protein